MGHVLLCLLLSEGGPGLPCPSVLGDQTPSFKSSSPLIPAACKCPGSLLSKEAVFQDWHFQGQLCTPLPLGYEAMSRDTFDHHWEVGVRGEGVCGGTTGTW